MEREGKTALGERAIRPERFLAGGFLAIILLGAALLCLPGAAVEGKQLSIFEGLFTSASAVCVTGLVAVDTGTTFSMFGQAVLLALIQVGGLGFMVFATLGLGLLGKRLSLKNRVLIRESMSGSTMSGLVRLTRVYGLMALVIELGGAALLAVRFVPRFGWGRGLWYAVFHAVSAFCNAGFDLFGHFSSLTGFAGDALVLGVIAALITLGGLGFFVIFDVIACRCRWKSLALHSKVVLLSSGALLLFGFVFYALAEWNNPQTLAAEGAGVGQKLLGAAFQSVTMRTAGFNSVDLAGLRNASKLVSCMLMFIGASPASTGGGVKTTTMSVLLLIVLSVARGEDETNVMKRRLSKELTRRALAILFIALMTLLVATMLLALAEPESTPLIDLLFEASSAVATVGVSSVGTPGLSALSRAVLIPVMYFGRVGPLTLALAIARKQSTAQKRVRYPEEKMMIG